MFWDGKRREVKAVIRHQMQCLAQYFLGKRSRYDSFRFDAVKLVARTRSWGPRFFFRKSRRPQRRRSALRSDYLGQPQGAKIGKSGRAMKDYGLTALSRRVYLRNVKKNDLPGLQQKLGWSFIGEKDRLFLFMLCKSSMEISTVPLAIQKRIVQPPKFELVG